MAGGSVPRGSSCPPRGTRSDQCTSSVNGLNQSHAVVRGPETACSLVLIVGRFVARDCPPLTLVALILRFGRNGLDSDLHRLGIAAALHLLEVLIAQPLAEFPAAHPMGLAMSAYLDVGKGVAVRRWRRVLRLSDRARMELDRPRLLGNIRLNFKNISSKFQRLN